MKSCGNGWRLKRLNVASDVNVIAGAEAVYAVTELEHGVGVGDRCHAATAAGAQMLQLALEHGRHAVE